MRDLQTEVKKNLETQIQKMEESGISNGGAAYNKYVQCLKNLNEFTKKQYETDSFGLNKKLTPELYRQLVQLYAECGKQGETVLEELKSLKEKPGYCVIQNIHNMLSTDMKVLNAVDEASLQGGTVSLQKIVDDARMRTVDISGKNLGTLGGEMSSRIPFNYVEADGHEIPGVFTPKSEFNMEANYDNMIASLKKSAPNYAAIFENLKKAAISFSEAQLKRDKKEPEEYTSGEKLFQAIECLAGPHYEIEARYIGMGLKSIDNEIFQQFKTYYDINKDNDEFKAFTKELFKYINQTGFNYGNAQISDHSRTDSRNSAMSAVADLLGVPNLICKAIPMKIIKDGVEIEGTFMSMAEGVDIKSPPEVVTSPSYSSDGSVFAASNGYKDVADLQVLDFICGNVDRHCGNMFYKFDNMSARPTEHKFSGVQGIDNDASFGSYVPTTKNENRSRLASLNGMKVISESMANKVVALSNEMLAFTLRNQGLTEVQINAAKARLELLRNYVQASYKTINRLDNDQKKFYREHPEATPPDTIRMIKDDQFCKLNLKDLCIKIKGNKTNSFDVVQNFREACRAEMKENPNPQKKAPEKIEEKKVFILDDAEVRWASDVVRKLNAATSRWRTSPQYEAVQAAAARYKAFCETNKGAVLSEDIYRIRTSYLENIKKTAEAYTDYKKSVTKPSSYTKRRIDTVAAVLNDSAAKARENFYEDMKKGMNDKELARYADGLRAYEDRALDDFNARMRKMAEEIAIKNGIKIPDKKIFGNEGLEGDPSKQAEPAKLI